MLYVCFTEAEFVFDQGPSFFFLLELGFIEYHELWGLDDFVGGVLIVTLETGYYMFIFVM